jgi:putative restriction endonuclease
MPDAPMNRLLNLKVAKDRKGMAPNKPLLVLAILDLVEAGLVGPEGLVHKDAQLNLRFRSYSPICVPRRGNAIDLGLPFRHLASDGVYFHVGEGDRTVKLESGLLAAMRVPAWRQEARRRVVATYFPPDEQVAPLTLMGSEIDVVKLRSSLELMLKVAPANEESLRVHAGAILPQINGFRTH